MNRKNIISLPNDHLRRRSKKVSTFDETLQTLVDNMKKVTLDWEDHRQHEFGVALAAVQIDVHEKVIVIRSNFEDKTDRTFMTFVNPKIAQRSGKPEVDFEGCLSVPDVYGKVPRYPRVKVRAKDEKGVEFTLKA
ncbi:MAG: peptide deformylase, partial [Candidatus Saccharimonadales bacterium]|nr:peptide deformylase [Candidatus Saccharimonadales bacterium]